MEYTRRELGKLALAVPCAAVLGRSETLFAGLVQAGKPNSRFGGVQIGTITYSYRSMPDQSAEATLKYIVESGISAIELMGGPVTQYAQARTGFTPSTGAAGRRGGGGRGAGGGGGAGRGGREGAPPAARLVAKNRWAIPATIEQEYTIPQGSDAVQEVKKCVEYCRAALA